jgi:hypothetical protein
VSAPAQPTPVARLRHPALCWLLAVVVLVQSVWVTFHLVSEPHLVPGLPGDGAARPIAATPAPGELPALVGDDRGGSDHTPHSALDHKAPKDKRGDELLPEAPPSDLPPPALLAVATPRCERAALPRAPAGATVVAVVATAPRGPPRG